MAGEGLLLVMADVGPEYETEFTGWLQQEHRREGTGRAGVLSARCYRAVEGEPKYLNLYDVADAAGLGRPELRPLTSWWHEASTPGAGGFGKLRGVTRGAYRRLLTLPEPEPADLSGARALVLLGLEVEPARDEEFQEWYDAEHLPALAELRGVLRARRFVLETAWLEPVGDPTKYLTLYDVERPEVQASDEWKRWASTPWTRRIRRFETRVIRNVYELIPRTDLTAGAD